ncbi:hypothetical protein VTN02DRAFT_3202 [Thermoascus thermophilus]
MTVVRSSSSSSSSSSSLARPFLVRSAERIWLASYIYIYIPEHKPTKIGSVRCPFRKTTPVYTHTYTHTTHHTPPLSWCFERTASWTFGIGRGRGGATQRNAPHCTPCTGTGTGTATGTDRLGDWDRKHHEVETALVPPFSPPMTQSLGYLVCPIKTQKHGRGSCEPMRSGALATSSRGLALSWVGDFSFRRGGGGRGGGKNSVFFFFFSLRKEKKRKKRKRRRKRRRRPQGQGSGSSSR